MRDDRGNSVIEPAALTLNAPPSRSLAAQSGNRANRLVQLQARANDAVDAPTSIIRPVLK
jgi:hypothetical protein